jgi:hypothetical protein
MEGIAAIIVQAIAGAVGGGVAGTLIKTVGMAILPKIIAGALGGVAGGSILGELVKGFGIDPGTAADAATAVGQIDFATLAAQVIGALGGGGVLTAIAGQFLGKKAA